MYTKVLQIEEGHKSIAYSITYRSKDKTLTDEDVAKVHEKILSELSEKIKRKLKIKLTIVGGGLV